MFAGVVFDDVGEGRCFEPRVVVGIIFNEQLVFFGIGQEERKPQSGRLPTAAMSVWMPLKVCMIKLLWRLADGAT